MIQTSMDLFVAPNVQKMPATKAAMTGEQPVVKFAELLEGMWIMPEAEEFAIEESEELDEQAEKLTWMNILSFAPPTNGIIQQEEQEQQAPILATAEQITQPVFVHKNLEPVISADADEESEIENLEEQESQPRDERQSEGKSVAPEKNPGTISEIIVGTSDNLPLKQQKITNKDDKKIDVAKTQENTETEAAETPETLGKSETTASGIFDKKIDKTQNLKTPDSQPASGGVEAEPKKEQVAGLNSEKEKSEPKFSKAPAAKAEKTESQPVERPAFSDFLSGITEQKRPGNAESTGKPSPQLNLQHTGRAAFTESVENVVRFARSEGVNRATIIIDPPALGKVSIEIVSTSSGIETSLKVSNEQVRALVQDQIVQLRHSLQQMGVQVTSFSVDVQQQEKGHEQFAEQGQKNNHRSADKETDNEVEEDVFKVDLRKGLLYWIA